MKNTNDLKIRWIDTEAKPVVYSAYPYAVSLSNDTDTLAFIAGPRAEAFYGGGPAHIRSEVLARLDARLDRRINGIFPPPSIMALAYSRVSLGQHGLQ